MPHTRRANSLGPATQSADEDTPLQSVAQNIGNPLGYSDALSYGDAGCGSNSSAATTTGAAYPLWNGSDGSTVGSSSYGCAPSRSGSSTSGRVAGLPLGPYYDNKQTGVYRYQWMDVGSGGSSFRSGNQVTCEGGQRAPASAYIFGYPDEDNYDIHRQAATNRRPGPDSYSTGYGRPGAAAGAASRNKRRYATASHTVPALAAGNAHVTSVVSFGGRNSVGDLCTNVPLTAATPETALRTCTSSNVPSYSALNM